MAKIVQMNNYHIADSGRYGKALETAFTGKAVKGIAKVDWTHLKERYEIKTNAGELAFNKRGKLAHCKKVLYIPVLGSVNEIDITTLEGFILDAETFVKVLDECGLIRTKKRTDGSQTMAIQTFWNHKKGAPHSAKKYGMLLDALYDNCIETLEEMLEREGR